MDGEWLENGLVATNSDDADIGNDDGIEVHRMTKTQHKMVV